jgi:large subunit ribosomal protein L4
MYNGAMRSIMSELLRTDRVIAIDKIDLKEVKTKEMNNILKEHNLKSVLIVTNEIDEKLFLSARNIKDVGIATVDYLDPPLMLSYKKVLIVKDALISFEKRFGG